MIFDPRPTPVVLTSHLAQIPKYHLHFFSPQMTRLTNIKKQYVKLFEIMRVEIPMSRFGYISAATDDFLSVSKCFKNL